MSKRLFLLLGCAALLTPASASAQASDDPADLARFHVGALALDPRFRIDDLGVDTNVFNTNVLPQKDLTATIGPALDAYFHVDRLRLTSKSTVDWTYFQKATKQRSVNWSQEGRADLVLQTLTPHFDAKYEQTRQRPNLEIDQRVRQRSTVLAGGIMFHFGTRLGLDVEEHHRTLDFGDQNFGDQALANSLNRVEKSTNATTTVELTPLTSLVVRAGWRRDRFDSHLRDSNSLLILPGFTFKPLAMLSGEAFVGYRNFRPQTTALEPFQGVVSTVNLTYVARDFLRLVMKVDRDVDYSFDSLTPYYIETGAGVTATQAIGRVWDVVGRLGRTQLAYRALSFAPPELQSGLARTDGIIALGAGLGRRLNERIRIGVDVDHAKRTSSVATRRYAGSRIGGSFTYGY